MTLILFAVDTIIILLHFFLFNAQTVLVVPILWLLQYQDLAFAKSISAVC